jgi:hypothetical protein
MAKRIIRAHTNRVSGASRQFTSGSMGGAAPQAHGGSPVHGAGVPNGIPSDPVSPATTTGILQHGGFGSGGGASGSSGNLLQTDQGAGGLVMRGGGIMKRMSLKESTHRTDLPEGGGGGGEDRGGPCFIWATWARLQGGGGYAHWCMFDKSSLLLPHSCEHFSCCLSGLQAWSWVRAPTPSLKTGPCWMVCPMCRVCCLGRTWRGGASVTLTCQQMGHR